MSPMFDAFLKFSDGQSLAGVVSTVAYGTYELDFETAAILRDEIYALSGQGITKSKK